MLASTYLRVDGLPGRALARHVALRVARAAHLHLRAHLQERQRERARQPRVSVVARVLGRPVRVAVLDVLGARVVAEHQAGGAVLLRRARHLQQRQVALRDLHGLVALGKEGVGGVGLEQHVVAPERPLQRHRGSQRPLRRVVQAVLDLLLERDGARLLHLQVGPHAAGQELHRRPVEVVLPGAALGAPQQVGPEAPARGRGPGVAQLVPEPVPVLAEVVDVEGLVEAPPHRPEEAAAEVVAAGRGLPEVRAAGCPSSAGPARSGRRSTAGRTPARSWRGTRRSSAVILSSRWSVAEDALKFQRGFGWQQEVNLPPLMR